MLFLSWVVVLAVLGLAGGLLFALSRSDRARAKRLAIPLAVILAASILFFGSDLAMQKLVSALVMPNGLFWLGLGGLAIHLFAIRERASAIAATVLFAFYSISASPWVASTLVSQLEDQIPEYSLEDGAKFDAVFVLGGGAVRRPDRGAQASENGDRVVLAARLYHLQKTPLLVTSGSTIPGLADPEDLTLATAEIWTSLGVPESAILRIPDPKNTSSEIAAYKAMIASRGFQRVGVVSSAWHLPRVLALAAKAGLEVTPIPADHRAGSGPLHPILLIPQPGAWKRTQLACWEMLGMVVGR
jgi:uncharacterized SAM-binding protein YcdF (DUF218 family)